jgi:hypothetical protein
MKRLIGMILICTLFLLTGCDDKDAREYANRLIDVLDSYQEEVDKKVSAEKDSYKELANAYDAARRRNIDETLEDERVERARKMAASMIDASHPPRDSEILESLRTYGDVDFGTTKDFLQVESDNQVQFLGDIEALEFESSTIDDLRASLKELAKPKGHLKSIRDAAVFAEDAKKEFDMLTCQDLSTEIKAIDSRLQAITAELVELNKDFKKNKDKIAAKQEEKDTLSKRKASVQNENKDKCS